jgi:aryl-alcohol dehydrogenase-like predicted oxidoreductase
VEYRQLGSSQLRVSRIGVGTSLARYDAVSEERLGRCLRAALDTGVTMFDSADVYGRGRAEELLGKELAGWSRDAVVISTKTFWPTGPDDWGLSRQRISRALEASLRRLDTDYVDLYLAHRYDYGTPLEETMRGFADVVQAGKARYIGISEWQASKVAQAAALAADLGVPLVCYQAVYSMIWRVAAAEVIPACAALGIGQVACSPLLSGLLGGRLLPGRPAPADSRVAQGVGGEELAALAGNDDLLERIQRLGVLAGAAGLSLSQLAHAWILQQPAMDAVLTGPASVEQLGQNLAAVHARLDDALLAAVDELLGPHVLADPRYDTSPRQLP